MFDDLTHRPNHVVRTCLLSDMPVDLGAEFEILGIRYRTGQHNRWSDRGKPIKRFGVAELSATIMRHLEISGAHVIAVRIPQDVRGCFRGRDVFGVAANYDGQLAFVVESGLRVWVD